jgi:hypothetical protein
VGAEAITAENATLAGAYTTSAGEIGSWMTTLPGSPPNRFAADASSQTIYVCYFAGTFPGIGSGVKPAGQTYGTMLVAIPVGGTAQLLLYGPATDSLSFDPPGNG